MNLKGIFSIVPGMSLLAGGCTGDQNATPATDTRPNIILIVADDHGRDDLGCYGNSVIKTPNIDALASEGIRMTNAYCTSASCSASRSVLLTGLYNHANGQYGHTHHYHHFSVFPRIKSLPVMLEEGGYATANVGKLHVLPLENFRFQKTFNANDRNTVAMADSCRDFIMNSSDPFFLYYCTTNPHRGGGIAEDLPYKPDVFGNIKEGYPGVEPVRYSPDEVIVPPYLPDSPACRAELAQYYESVSRIDQGVGRLMQWLKESGKYENTIIIYLSDNGIAFPGAKTSLYDGGMHLPCIFVLPGMKNKGSVSNAMITWADITPTLLDFAGILTENNQIPGFENEPDPKDKEVPWFKTFHGRTIRPALETLESKGYDEVFASHTFHEITMYYPMKVIQNRQYKLIWNIAWQLPYPHSSDIWESATWQYALENNTGKFSGKTTHDYTFRPEYELYDMVKDPGETTNLAARKEMQEVLESMKTRIRQEQERTSDPWIIKWTHE